MMSDVNESEPPSWISHILFNTIQITQRVLVIVNGALLIEWQVNRHNVSERVWTGPEWKRSSSRRVAMEYSLRILLCLCVRTAKVSSFTRHAETDVRNSLISLSLPSSILTHLLFSAFSLNQIALTADRVSYGLSSYLAQHSVLFIRLARTSSMTNSALPFVPSSTDTTRRRTEKYRIPTPSIRTVASASRNAQVRH